MIDCPHCGKRHRSEDALVACAKRRASHEARAARIEEDRQRREERAAKEPAADFIRRAWARDGMAWVNVVSALNKEYPPPEGKKKWTLLDAIRLDNERLNWPF